MNGFIATFRMGFKYLWRSPTDVLIFTAFPIVLILVLGTALASFVSSDISLEPIKVAVAADQNGQLGTFLQSDDISRFLESEFIDKAQAGEQAKEGNVTAAIIEEGADISVVLSASDDMNASIVLSIIDSYKQIGTAASIAANAGRDVYRLLEIEPKVTDMPLGIRQPNSLDYYAVTMLVMILMYTGMNGMELFKKGMISETGARVRISPVSTISLTGGLLAASTITSYLQGLVTFAFSSLVYGVDWGERIPLVLITLFGVVLFSQSLCIFIVMAVRNHGIVTGLTQAIIMAMTLVSKGYVIADFGKMERVFQYAPNAMAHTVIFGAIYGGNETRMMTCLAALFLTGIVLFILAFSLGRRRIV